MGAGSVIQSSYLAVQHVHHPMREEFQAYVVGHHHHRDILIHCSGTHDSTGDIVIS